MAALRRKKNHEHSKEQTMGQIGTLEQQINAIESANINRETLAAMEKASEAMQQIHGKLTPEKVDETMYVENIKCLICLVVFVILHTLGTSSVTKTLLARKLSMPLRITSWASRWMRPRWRTSWSSCSRSSWTSRF
jgi:hypothetical protein